MDLLQDKIIKRAQNIDQLINYIALVQQCITCNKLPPYFYDWLEEK